MYRAEYIWIDGTEDPYPGLRSKTKDLADGNSPGICVYDGSSTNQAPGANSDVVLKPQFVCPDPIRGGNDILVMCDTYAPEDMSPLPTNTRVAAVAAVAAFMVAVPQTHKRITFWVVGTLVPNVQTCDFRRRAPRTIGMHLHD